MRVSPRRSCWSPWRSWPKVTCKPSLGADFVSWCPGQKVFRVRMSTESKVRKVRRPTPQVSTIHLNRTCMLRINLHVSSLNDNMSLKLRINYGLIIIGIVNFLCKYFLNSNKHCALSAFNIIFFGMPTNSTYTLGWRQLQIIFSFSIIPM